MARRVEERIGRKLDIVSGGVISSYMRVLDGNIPEGINNLRMGGRNPSAAGPAVPVWLSAERYV